MAVAGNGSARGGHTGNAALAGIGMMMEVVIEIDAASVNEIETDTGIETENVDTGAELQIAQSPAGAAHPAVAQPAARDGACPPPAWPR